MEQKENNTNFPFSIGPFNAWSSIVAWYGETRTIDIPDNISFSRPVPFKMEEHPWYNALSDYNGSSLIYINNESFFQDIIPFIAGINHPVFLISEYEIPEETDLPDYVTVLTLEFSSVYLYYNDFLEKNYPMVFHYFNTFDTIVQLLNPDVIISDIATSFQQEILSCISMHYRIPYIKK